MNTRDYITHRFALQCLRLWQYALAALVLFTTTSCFESASPLCSSGIRCPAHMVCTVDGQSCTERTCGNGIVESEAGEMCDDGKANSNEPDACRDDCQEPRCGDGVPDTGEVCDDGNNADTDGCSSDCQSNEACGNGILDIPAGELCDDGNTFDGDSCRTNCVIPLCGDRIIDEQFGEACDCGDDPAQLPEGCTMVNSSLADAECRRNCQLGRCGDGIKDSDEVCDDGNNASGDGCAADCQSDETCGNGYPDTSKGEECDDGNTVTRDGCSSQCQIEEISWRHHSLDSVSPPSARSGHAMVYDTARDRIVLFGGSNGGGDTWEWDGRSWQLIESEGPGPSAREDHAMAYDAARGRVVLFGGDIIVPLGGYNNGIGNDTWEWDGRSWQLIEPEGPGPSAREDHSMAYDAARDRVVVFGGYGGYDVGRLDDTWEWDGRSWQLIEPQGPGPSARSSHTMAYDAARGRVVVFGGYGRNDVGRLDDLWEWDGRSWQLIEPQGSVPSARDDHAMVYGAARGRVVLFGGHDGSFGGRLGDTWEWDGESRRFIHFDGPGPPARSGHTMIYAVPRGRVVLFGGNDDDARHLNETWEWDGQSWQLIKPQGPWPSVRSSHAMAYDAVRGRGMLFGGYDGERHLDDTWEWAGQAWQLLDLDGPGPSARSGHVMAYDANRGRVVLFGGYGGERYLNDTWEWDGQSWQFIDLNESGPSTRSGYAMAYTATRGRIVLFGGYDGERYLDDTWEWDGQSWQFFDLNGLGPSARSGHAMTYTAARGRIALLGGYDGERYLDDTWEWTGQSWQRIEPLGLAPAARYEHAIAYDAIGDRVLVFGGYDGQRLDDIWDVGYLRNGQVYDSCVNDIDNDGDGFIGCDDPDCWAYCTPHCTPYTASCETALPHCGDGTCNRSLENFFNCPVDCTACGNFQCEPGESLVDWPGDCGYTGGQP